MNKIIISGFLILLISLGAFGQEGDETASEKQQLYVTDKLLLSLYRESGGKGGTIKLLASGNKLTIEEVTGAYALVTTSAGKKGWVKRGFLVLEPTSNLMLEEEKRRNENLVQEIEKLKNSKVIIDQYEKDLTAMNEKLQTVISEKDTAESTVAFLQQTIEKKTKEIESLSDHVVIPTLELLSILANAYWKYMIAIAALTILTGFFIGKLIIEARVKKKFHGIKVW